MMNYSVRLINKTYNSCKYSINDRYIVYLNKCSVLNIVTDGSSNKDITNTNKGCELICAAYNFKNAR